MGIPKFFRWLSERYPLINQIIDLQNVGPIFDNFYLDMNGIIHQCTHPSDDVSLVLSQDEMFTRMFRYIDNLFHIIKPRKIFYLAIDGVAPRAKMNQQRQRRFRTAKAREDFQKMSEHGEKLPETTFDSNCITPGTEFMQELTKHIKFFIRKKLKEDPAWRKVTIIFSGHEVPGEGEHKIMDFIRRLKAQPDYDPNQSHCMYGQDADLIVLSLVTHEPNFAIIREVTFDRRKIVTDPDDQKFHLTHISLLREYLELDFNCLKDKLPFKFDLERIIDDFVLLTFFVGNDFLPHLPGLDIAEGSLNLIFQFYKELLPTMPDYLTFGGKVNWDSLQILFKKLAQHERSLFDIFPVQFEHIENQFNDEKPKPENENGDHSIEITTSQKPQLADVLFGNKRDEIILPSDGGYSSNVSEDDDSWKHSYYKEKFGSSFETEKDFVRRLCQSYLEALQWVLYYYYDGCMSWNWYFPFHYAPLVSDIGDVKSYDIKFDLSKPFLPLQQLLSVLPAASRRLLPLPYQRLMIDANSPLNKFFPMEFSIDRDGKKNAWEGIALIPFIDEKILLEETGKIKDSDLKEEERQRNQFGETLVFRYNERNKERYPSSLPHLFPDIEECHSDVEVFELPPLPPGVTNKFQLMEGTKIGLKASAGHPTLKTITHQGILKHVGVTIFGTRSRRESLLLILNPTDHVLKEELSNITTVNDNEPLNYDLDDEFDDENFFEEPPVVEDETNSGGTFSTKEISSLALRTVGKSIFVWPYHKEAHVLRLTTAEGEWDSWGQLKQWSPQSKKEWKRQAMNLQHQYRIKKAIEVGSVQAILDIQYIEGIDRSRDGTLNKRFSTKIEQIPLQIALESPPSYDPRFEPHAFEIREEFPVGSFCVFRQGQYFGCIARVLGHQSDRVKICLELSSNEFDFVRRIVEESKSAGERYFPLDFVARSLEISCHTLSKITGCVRFNPGNVNLGLNIKLTTKNLQILGYTRKVMRTTPFGTSSRWEFSEKALQLLKEYKQRFPEVFQLIEKYPSQSTYNFDQLFSVSSPSSNGELKPQKNNSDIPHKAENVALVSQKAEIRAVNILKNEKNQAAPFPNTNTIPLKPNETPASNNAVSPSLKQSTTTTTMTSLIDSTEELPNEIIVFKKLSQAKPPIEIENEAFRSDRSTNVLNESEVIEEREENVLEEIEEDVNTEDIEQQLEENIKVPTIKERIKELLQWIRSVPTANLPRIPCGSKVLSSECVKKLEEELDKHFARKRIPKPKEIILTVPPSVLLKPLEDLEINFESACDAVGNDSIHLGDRVINVRNHGNPPFGVKGTVIAIKGHMVDVLLDQRVIGGTSLSGLCSPFRGITLPIGTVINLSCVPPFRYHVSEHPLSQPNKMPSPSPKIGAQYGSSEYRYGNWSHPQPFFKREYFRSSLPPPRPNGKPLYDVDPRRFLPNSSNPQKTKQMPLSSTSQSIQQPQSLLQLAPHQAQTLQETYEKHPELYPAVVQQLIDEQSKQLESIQHQNFLATSVPILQQNQSTFPQYSQLQQQSYQLHPLSEPIFIYQSNLPPQPDLSYYLPYQPQFEPQSHPIEPFMQQTNFQPTNNFETGEDSTTNDKYFNEEGNEEPENAEFSSSWPQKGHFIQNRRTKRGTNTHTRSVERGYFRGFGMSPYNRNLSRDYWNPSTSHSYHSSFYYNNNNNSYNTNSQVSTDTLTWQQHDLLKRLYSNKKNK